MSVFFLRKKVFLAVLYILSFIVTGASIVYAVIINNAQVYKHGQTFYFLVSQNPHLEVSGFEIKAENGAGYLLETNEKPYIALSVYLQEKDAKTALQSAKEKFNNLTLVLITSGDLYFITPSQKKQRKLAISGLNTFLGGIRAIDNEIGRLEKGATQQSSKRVLKDIAKTIRYLGEENKLFYNAGARATSALRKSVENIIYLKDLRYLLCELCMEYAGVCSKFSL